jgi:Protein of unknown function (DUF3224)
MRRRLTWALVLCVTVVLALVLVPAAGARPHQHAARAAAAATAAPTPTPVSGVWSWYGGEFLPAPDGDTTYFSGYELGRWTGGFEGTSYEPFGGVAYPDGRLWAVITINFKGTVDGVRGKFVMQLTALYPLTEGADDEGGMWTIISGTGGLRSLRGVGSWVYTHSDEQYSYGDYSGVMWRL